MKRALLARRLSQAVLACGAAGFGMAGTLFEENFDKVQGEAVPESFTVLDGQFAVQGEGKERSLVLPGAPLESFGFLFGPAAVSGREVRARIQGTRTGRKFPTFAAGLNGVNGYKVRVSPAKNAVEIVAGDAQEVKASVPFAWKSGEWTSLRLRVTPATQGVRVEAKAWQGSSEPAGWTLAFDAPEAPPSGMAGAWGMPYSGTPIRFDDLVVADVGK